MQRPLVGCDGWRQGITVAVVITRILLTNAIQILTSLARTRVQTGLLRGMERLDWKL